MSNLQKPHSGEFATKVKELRRLHALIEVNSKALIKYAIEAGEILYKTKIEFTGNFDEWVDKETNFRHTTASRYIGAYLYQNQIADADNLSKAYKMIETLEAQKKQKETASAYQRVAEYRKTGVKPENWRRGTDDKIAKEEVERDTRIEKVKQETLNREKERQDKEYEQEEKKRYREQQQEQYKKETDDLIQSLEQSAKELQKRIDFKEKIRLSADGMKDPFQDAIIDYLDSLNDDNRRIEVCYNIIKICKRIANELQANKAD